MASDRGRKEQSPPPLLLMPAGEGLTMSASPVPNLLMPIAQPEQPLIPSDEEAEADSFLGQSPIKPTPRSQFSMFSQLPEPGNDPFSQISQPSGRQVPPGASALKFKTPEKTPPRNTSTPPMMGSPLTVPAPPVSNNTPVASIPPMMAAPPKGQPQNYHRLQGPPRYAQPPPGTYATNSPASSNLQQISPPMSMSSQPPPAVSQPPTPLPGSTSSFPSTDTSPTQPPPPPMSSYTPPNPVTPPQSSNMYPSTMGVPGFTYQPVQHHWFFCKRIELKLLWFPFSHIDSSRLEEAYNTAKQDGGNTIVRTSGDRFDVDVNKRTRRAVYWEEDPSQVRRCSWFYKQEGDNKFVPYEEDFAEKLEEEYKNTITNNMWHKRLEFPGGETIVMHNPQVIVHFRSSSQPDEWGTTQGEQLRPRVVKRGIDDFDSIEEGEGSQVDHLVFVIHGIGPVCDLRFRSIVECVDDFRSISLSIMKSHFRSYVDEGRVGRVEFLPVHWHSALHGDATGIDRRLKAITLSSIAKLRHFTNDTLLDILFYASPTYSQQIIDTITSEMNRIYDLFLSRNQTFNGEVSVAGHSLGALILFDLLLNQGNDEPANEPYVDKSQMPVKTTVPTVAVSPSPVEVPSADDDDNDIALEVLLEKLGISNLLPKFQQEQIDMDTLTLCDETDIKEMGIPMGPRKKLLSFMKERKEKQIKRQESKTRTAEVVAVQRSESEVCAAHTTDNHNDAGRGYPLLQTGSSTYINYVVGPSGIGVPNIKYPQLTFEPSNFFAIGSPISMFLTVRGVENLGEEFRFPTCPGFFNVFHPFDPVAYRMEPLISQMYNPKPVLIPHHKGRKRLHLELRDSLSRVGESLKQRIVDSVRSTWNTINDFARAHRTTPEEVVNEQVDNVLSEMSKEEDDRLETESIASSVQEDGQFGSLNQGRRIDYVLQEKPIESFNDYLFALGSHMCYWESEDTVLLILKETYALSGIVPDKPGQRDRKPPLMASPQGFPPYPAASPIGSPQHQPPPPSHPPISSHPSHMAPPLGSVAPPPGPMVPPSSFAPPPMHGFVRTTK